MLSVDILNKFIQNKYPELTEAYLSRTFNKFEKSLYSNNIDKDFDYISIYNLGPKITYKTIYLIPGKDSFRERSGFFITKNEILTLLAIQRDKKIKKLCI